MIIHLRKKRIKIGGFLFRCSIGKGGLKKNKIEGDEATPKGTYLLGTIYFRPDRIVKPIAKTKIKEIKKDSGWCDDPSSIFYNKEIKINKNFRYSYEKLYRKDNKYDLFIVIEYNFKKTVKNKGSAIFIHSTKSYRPTKGCIALKAKDLMILTKIINKKTKIKIN